MDTCYRHPGRETGVSCSNCANPICTDCMTSTSVGMRCPECARERTKVHTVSSMTGTPTATYALIAINALVFLGSSSTSGATLRDFALFGPSVDAANEYYRLVSSGFLHGGIIHILFNMYILHWLGSQLEPSLGTPRFVALYFASLLAGSFGALLLSPMSLTVGASGAVFGLMAATFVTQRARGIDPMQSGIGPLILLNLAIGFIPGLNISIGGHLGGLIGGALAAMLMDRLGARRRGVVLPIAACVLVGVIAVAGSLAVAGRVVG